MIDITEHMGLAYHITWKIYPKVSNKYEFEDLFQIACIGLLKARNNFDESKGFKFTTYAVATIRGEVIRFLADDKKFNISRGVPHGFSVLSYEFGNENGCLQDKVGSNEFEDKVINSFSLKEAIRELSDQEKKLYYANEMTQCQIAEIFGGSQMWISKMNKRIIKKLRISLGVQSKKVSM